ncbi:hypothetical protein SMD20_27655 [Nonomuraea sp. LP-02]|uniref:hypothetical protein n=1 Tax=Nonomuraea sp. LP-02 TaxID=3097960 RepID=UPI002E34FFB7|nr:hypothetical protein [Nonomuraea sp. LP-02]MED7928064.1 hypothetical protein [Nonomuraea sp. LP-02]
MVVTADQLKINGIRHHVSRNLLSHTPEQQFAFDMVLNPKTDFMIGRWFGEGRASLLLPDMPQPSWIDGTCGDLVDDSQEDEALVSSTIEIIGVLVQAMSEAAKYAYRHQYWEMVWECLDATSAFGHALNGIAAGDQPRATVPVVFVVRVMKILRRVADHIHEHGWTRADEPGLDSVWELDRRMARRLRKDAEAAARLLNRGIGGSPSPPDTPTAA